jgi:ADP-ribosylglycohydrolase/protein-tyrosine phosphatase
MTIAPGMKAASAAGAWERDLQADLERLRNHFAVEVLVSLMEAEELEGYGIPDLLDAARNAGIEVVHFPIPDVLTPRKSEAKEYAKLITRIVDLLEEGKTVVVHCRGGLGRTGTVAASVLVALGYPPSYAIGKVRAVRSDRAVETMEQEQYVERFEIEWRERYSPETMLDRYRGSLLGLAAGDALGTTLEFELPGSFEPAEDIVGGGPFGLAPGEWTDDTSMALCLAESLIEKRGFDPLDQMKKYVRWYGEGHMSPTGECFDIGDATSSALERFENTGDPYSGSTDPHSAGNGSIMRLAPIALFYARLDNHMAEPGASESVIERSGESSRTTHGARTTVDTCRYLGGLIAGAVNGASKGELLSGRYSPFGSEYWDHHPLVDEIDEVAAGSFKWREPPEIRGRTYVVRSLEAALWAFHKSESFREGALLAVNLGDDADTTGAVYGQLAGAFYGESGIPESWRLKLAHRLLIEHFAEQLFRLAPA